MTFKDTARVLAEGNKGAFKASAKRRTGNMINQRVVGLITPRLPFWARSYAETSLGQAVICNMVAGAVIKYLPSNEKAILAADAMVTASMDDFVGSFNIEEMINDVLDGIDLSGLSNATDTAREATSSTLEKAAKTLKKASENEGVA